jgi:hypothetical protein
MTKKCSILKKKKFFLTVIAFILEVILKSIIINESIILIRFVLHPRDFLRLYSSEYSPQVSMKLI